MEFDRMGKNISSTKSIPFFLFLSLWKSLEKFLYVEHRKSNTAKFSATFFPPKRLLYRKNQTTTKFSVTQYAKKLEKRWKTGRRTSHVHRPIFSRHGDTRGLIKRKQWSLNDPIKRKLGLMCKKEGAEFERSFPGDAFSRLLFDTWRRMIVEKGGEGEGGGRKKAGEVLARTSQKVITEKIEAVLVG